MWPSIIGDGGGRCDELGVWGSTVGLVGVAMAGEVLKVILGQDGELTKNGYTSRLLIT